MNKKGLVLIFLTSLALVNVGLFWAIFTGRFSIKKPAITSGASTETNSPEVNLGPKEDQNYTNYTNEEFGFSIAYLNDWDLPEEKRITPSQQHLYTINLNPDDEIYIINIYDQPSPISLGSFVRGYFDVGDGVSWTQETEINNQEALQFVLPQGGLTPTGIGAVAFRQGSYVLVIQTPIKEAPEKDLKQLVNNPIIIQLAESFQWIE
ncbi:MAG TPA: hypothetical protein VMY36_02730 [Patescibacteria group bacterium]|nr:hypothetical protein [Patescibacteria group bacterium]